MNNKFLNHIIETLINETISEEKKKKNLDWDFPKTTPPWKDIAKVAKKNTLVPKDEPGQEKTKKESSTFGSDSFQGGAFGFGAEDQLSAPARHVPPEEKDTNTTQLSSARDREKLTEKK